MISAGGVDEESLRVMAVLHGPSFAAQLQSALLQGSDPDFENFVFSHKSRAPRSFLPPISAPPPAARLPLQNLQKSPAFSRSFLTSSGGLLEGRDSSLSRQQQGSKTAAKQAVGGSQSIGGSFSFGGLSNNTTANTTTAAARNPHPLRISALQGPPSETQASSTQRASSAAPPPAAAQFNAFSSQSAAAVAVPPPPSGADQPAYWRQVLQGELAKVRTDFVNTATQIVASVDSKVQRISDKVEQNAQSKVDQNELGYRLQQLQQDVYSTVEHLTATLDNELSTMAEILAAEAEKSKVTQAQAARQQMQLVQSTLTEGLKALQTEIRKEMKAVAKSSGPLPPTSSTYKSLADELACTKKAPLSDDASKSVVAGGGGPDVQAMVKQLREELMLEVGICKRKIDQISGSSSVSVKAVARNAERQAGDESPLHQKFSQLRGQLRSNLKLAQAFDTNNPAYDGSESGSGQAVSFEELQGLHASLCQREKRFQSEIHEMLGETKASLEAHKEEVDQRFSSADEALSSHKSEVEEQLRQFKVDILSELLNHRSEVGTQLKKIQADVLQSNQDHAGSMHGVLKALYDSGLIKDHQFKKFTGIEDFEEPPTKRLKLP